MTNEELEQFTDVMMKKAPWTQDYTASDEENRRSLIRMVIADTYLLVSGSVPIERWLESEAAP